MCNSVDLNVYAHMCVGVDAIDTAQKYKSPFSRRLGIMIYDLWSIAA